VRTTWDRPRVKFTPASILGRYRCSAARLGTLYKFNSTSFGYWDGCVSTDAPFGTVTEYAGLVSQACSDVIADVTTCRLAKT